MNVRIIVYSDYVCPFCYLGNEVLKALENEYDFSAEWRGYVIHKEGKASRYLEPGYVDNKWNILSQLASEMNKTVKRPDFVPETLLALEGSEYAKSRGLFKEFHDRVFEAYFEEGKDIGNRDVITRIAQEAGMNSSEFWGAIESGEPAAKLEEYRKEAQKNFITAFPTFLFDGISEGHFRLIGAHPYQTMKLHLENYMKRRDRILANLS